MCDWMSEVGRRNRLRCLGRVAQRKSTRLTTEGAQVRSLPRPPRSQRCSMARVATGVHGEHPFSSSLPSANDRYELSKIPRPAAWILAAISAGQCELSLRSASDLRNTLAAFG